MTLKKYLANRNRGFKTEFAKAIGTSLCFLWHIANGKKQVPHALAKRIEKETEGKVKKEELRPDIWGE